MDRETGSPPTEAPATEAAATDGLPPIFRTPTYPSGEKATREPATLRETAQEQTREQTREETPASDGQEPGETGAAPRRRRRRGGRGRGGRGRGGGAAGTETGTETETDTDTVDRVEPAGAGQATDTDHAAPARPRRRRRSGPSAASAPGAAEPEVVEADVDVTAETQRDDAEPDADAGSASGSGSTARRRRRRRGGRGRRKPSATAPEAAEADAAPAAPAKPARGSKAPKTLEEQVASGGPTRGLRARTPRAGGRTRRQREPQVAPPRTTDKLMVITEHGERDQIAVLEEHQLVQHYVTRRGAHSMVGNVYLGRIQNVLPGMEAAFVDIGRGRNGVLYAGEVNYSPEDLDGKPPRIENVLKSGQAVMVQVTKDPMGGKGARLTAQISLPGRFLVLAPDQDASGISRRLSENARKRLKTILNAIRPKGDGVIVRTAAEGASEEEITRDLQRLTALWDQIEKAAKKAKAPAVLYEEPELTVRVVRDLFTDEEFRGLVTDSQPIYDKVMAYVRDVAPDLESKVTLHRGPLSAFEHHRIDEQILKALDRKVWLPSGGYLVIERTEAMTIVDVNTGKSVGKTNLEETVLNTNLEAAREVARQLRLRDIGGIIVIDFIDMLLEQNKRKIEDTMREALAVDKTRSQVFEIGPLGLMQVTRKRVSSGLVDSFSETCPTCEGRGILVHYDAS
jgi:ribonuclease E